MVASLATEPVIQIPEGFDSFVMMPNPQHRLTDEQFEQFCAQYPELRIEMTSEGDMIVMLPVFTQGGNRNFILTSRFGTWAEPDNSGVGFDSSTGFTLPNGAKRSPDVSWIRRERWDALTEKQKNSFTRLCPDFVVELRSTSDRLKTLQKKMEEYIANGAKLGWLIDPLEKKVHVYQPDVPVQILDNPSQVSGDPLLKGFTLNLSGIFD